MTEVPPKLDHLKSNSLEPPYHPARGTTTPPVIGPKVAMCFGEARNKEVEKPAA
jgi:hypothetical protein